jgi:hypothetical protein
MKRILLARLCLPRPARAGGAPSAHGFGSDGSTREQDEGMLPLYESFALFNASFD